MSKLKLSMASQPGSRRRRTFLWWLESLGSLTINRDQGGTAGSACRGPTPTALQALPILCFIPKHLLKHFPAAQTCSFLMLCVMIREICIKHSGWITKYDDDYLENSTWAIQLQPELAAAFHGAQFLVERVAGRQAVFIQMWTLGRYFLKMDEISLSLKGNQWMVFVANDNFQVSNKGEHIIHNASCFYHVFLLNFLSIIQIEGQKQLSSLSDSSHMVFIIWENSLV